MNFQLNFFISKEKEKELFDFVRETCQIVHAYSAEPDLFLKPDEDICKLKYLFVPKEYSDDITIIEDKEQIIEGGKYVVYPMNAYLEYGPYIEYERFEDGYRIYANVTRMRSTYLKRVKFILALLKKWVRAHAVSVKYVGIRVYIIQ